MKNILLLILLALPFAITAQENVQRHGYSVDSISTNQFYLVDTVIYKDEVGGLPLIEIKFIPFTSKVNIASYFEVEVESDLRQGVSSIKGVGNIVSAIKTISSSSGFYNNLAGQSFINTLGEIHGPSINTSSNYNFTPTQGAGNEIEVAIEATGGGAYQLRRISNNATFTLIPLPLNAFYIQNFNIGNGVTEDYIFVLDDGVYKPFESYFNKYAEVKLESL